MMLSRIRARCAQAVQQTRLPSPSRAGELHMEKSRRRCSAATERLSKAPTAVRVSILVRSASDSLDRCRSALATHLQVADATREFPYAIPLPWRGRVDDSANE